MKPPEEIKKGLKQCCDQNVGCNGCPYDNDCRDPSGTVNVEMDSLAYIQWLESRLAQVERENKAMLRDMTAMAINYESNWVCDFCGGDSPLLCERCKIDYCGFKWRGVCAENTEEPNT